MSADAPLCPACGQINACQANQMREGSACWCASVQLNPAVFALIESRYGDGSCLCKSCLEKLNREATAASATDHF